jgi:beta-glucosidase
LALPASQQKLLEAIQATGKPVVLVLMTGSALAVNWAEQHVPAILLAWYPGQQGGNAIADVLFGDVNPAGRLPITFYKSTDQLPPFADYAMEGRTYRYFRGQALYPFGYGQSYTRFEYSGLGLDKPAISTRDSVEVTLTVKNVGERDGDEVVQLYVRDPESKLRTPVRTLRGFERVALKRGEAQTVRFRLSPAKDFTHYDESKRAYAVEPGEFEIQLGASSQDIRLAGRVRVDP